MLNLFRNTFYFRWQLLGTTQVPLARQTTTGSSSTSAAEAEISVRARITFFASKIILREEFPVFAGDYIEATGEITKIGNSSRKMTFEAKKVIRSRTDISASAADVLDEPVVVCRASGTCVVPKTCQRK